MGQWDIMRGAPGVEDDLFRVPPDSWKKKNKEKEREEEEGGSKGHWWLG